MPREDTAEDVARKPVIIRLPHQHAQALSEALIHTCTDLPAEISRQVANAVRYWQQDVEYATRADALRAFAQAQREDIERAASANDLPFPNPLTLNPSWGIRARHQCENHVFSGGRSDMTGHQCGANAKWLRPDFDEYGDIALCVKHHLLPNDELHRSTPHNYGGSGETLPSGWRKDWRAIATSLGKNIKA